MLKHLLSHLSKVIIFFAKSSLRNLSQGVFLNFKKNLSESLLNTMSLRTSVNTTSFKTLVKYYEFKNLRNIPWVLKTYIKYHEFQNLCKIQWVSKPLLNTMGCKIYVKYHGFQKFCKMTCGQHSSPFSTISNDTSDFSLLP